MQEEKLILQIKGIDKHFGGVHALNKVSFSVRKGEVHAIVGENGAGKSTLMKILAGTYQSDEGSILINSQKKIFNNRLDAYEAGINIIYQEFYAFPTLDVISNVFCGREITKNIFLNENEMRRRTWEVFNQMGVNIDLDVLVKYLPVADQQIIEIAKALVYKGEIVIMDEPNSALTDKETQALFDIIKRLKKEGITVLYVSHRLEEVFKISDRITVLRDGNYEGTWDKNKTNIPFIISKMIGRSLEKAFPGVPKIEKNVKPILEVKNVNKQGKLQNVSFNLKPGEVLGFAGLEGSGIREIFHILFGISHMDEGELIYQGNVKHINFSNDAIKIGWGMIPANRRDHGLIMRWSIRDNVALVIFKKLIRFLGLINDKKVEITALEFIKKLKIATSSPDKRVFDLSGGNQQKVVISKWLATKPRVLILDDPTRGIDVGAKSEIYYLIRDLAKEGLAIIFNSSEIDEVLGLSNRILVMRQGTIVKEVMHDTLDKKEIFRYISGDINLT